MLGDFATCCSRCHLPVTSPRLDLRLPILDAIPSSLTFLTPNRSSQRPCRVLPANFALHNSLQPSDTQRWLELPRYGIHKWCAFSLSPSTSMYTAGPRGRTTNSGGVREDVASDVSSANSQPLRLIGFSACMR